MGAVPLVRVVRGGITEAVHLGHVAVCDADARLIASAGDPGRMVFARSCMKPLQAVVSLTAIGEELPDRETAIMCASHNGEPIHIGAVRALLERAGLDADALMNPPGWPLDAEAMAASQHQHKLLHNCSGKHAGMLLACVRAGWDGRTYLRSSHPLQRRVLRAVKQASGEDELELSVDGCGVPVHGMPLRSMATLFARLTEPERLGGLAPAADRATQAMLVDPYLVGGRRRVDTDLMMVTGDVVAKSGAEGLECAAILPSGLGVAVKVEDGGGRAAAPALIRALHQVDALSASQLKELSNHASPEVSGGGKRVGALEVVFDLRSAGQRTSQRTGKKSASRTRRRA
ncbi:MAG: asparaginase [Actinomycetota bacterium]